MGEGACVDRKIREETGRKETVWEEKSGLWGMKRARMERNRSIS